MRERVSLQAPTEVRSATGEATLTWQTQATVWASVDGLSSRDILQAQQANVVATHRIRIRHRDDVAHTHRLVWRNRTMEIASVTDRMGREVLEVLARELT
ncbi:MAG: phage head closure protein [Phycisphaerales bacterium]